jgi:hypothetical protein
MSRTLTAQDRSALIRLASGLPKGDTTRRAILAGLTQVTASKDFNIRGKHILENAQTNVWTNVMDNAKVYGNASIAKARIYDNAQVYGDAQVYGSAFIYGDAQVYDDAKVYADAEVFGNAKVSGDAKVFGAKTKIGGTAVILGGVWHNVQVMSGTWIAPEVPFQQVDISPGLELKGPEIFKQIGDTLKKAFGVSVKFPTRKIVGGHPYMIETETSVGFVRFIVRAEIIFTDSGLTWTIHKGTGGRYVERSPPPEITPVLRNKKSKTALPLLRALTDVWTQFQPEIKKESSNERAWSSSMRSW